MMMKPNCVGAVFSRDLQTTTCGLGDGLWFALARFAAEAAPTGGLVCVCFVLIHACGILYAQPRRSISVTILVAAEISVVTKVWPVCKALLSTRGSSTYS